MNQEDLTALFDKLNRKVPGGQHVEAGWLKYEYNGAAWDLDDGVSLCFLGELSTRSHLFQTQTIRYLRGDNSTINLIHRGLIRMTRNASLI